MKKVLMIGLTWCLALSGLKAQVQDKALEFLDYLVHNKNKAAYQMLDSSVRGRIDPFTLSQIWPQIKAEYGPLQDTGAILIDDWNGTKVYVELKFNGASLDLEVSFSEAEMIKGFFIKPPRDKRPFAPAPYADTSRIRTERFDLYNSRFKLPGLLTFPKTNDKRAFPLVILVHGSGPQSHRGKLGPNEIFTDLAHGLAMQGIATYRYDKRTLAYGSRSADHPDSLTIWEEVLEDALVAVDTLSNHPLVNSDQIYVLGHSLGGYLAPILAEKNEAIRGLILTAAPARPLDTVVLDQYRFLDSIDPSGTLKRPLYEMERSIEFLRSNDFDLEADAAYLPLGLPAKYWMSLLNYDPLSITRELKCKVMIAQGGKDYQVTYKDFARWSALANLDRVTMHWYPDLGHGMFVGGPEPGPKQYDHADHVSEQFILDIVAFIQKP